MSSNKNVIPKIILTILAKHYKGLISIPAKIIVLKTNDFNIFLGNIYHLCVSQYVDNHEFQLYNCKIILYSDNQQ